jgi:Flp pilus assembly protein TadD
VKLLSNISVFNSFTGRSLLLAGVLMLGACASPQPVKNTPPPLQNFGPAQQVAEVDILEPTPEMDEFLERYVLKYSDMHTRVYLLMSSISSNGVLGYKYDAGLTLTAKEAFETRSGNCIGFANMMIVLARKAGMKAHYQEVFRRPEWANHEDTVLLVKHINVILEIPGYTYVVDISGVKINPNMRRRIITDSYAKALYWNNIGAEALLEDDLPTAHAYMAKAIETEPFITDAWVNLGVVFGRSEQLDDAEFVLQNALALDASSYSAMSNLYEVYVAQEDLESADALHDKVEKYRQSNPYYLLKLSDEAIAEARFDESITLLRRAIRKKKNDHQLHFALAKTQYLSGELVAAEGSLVRARELAPQDMLAYYGKPLDQLVAEEQILNTALDP